MVCDPSLEVIGGSFTGTDRSLDVTGGDEAFGQAFITGSNSCLRRLTVKWKYGNGSPIIVEIVPNLFRKDPYGLFKDFPAIKPQSGVAIGSWGIPAHSGTPGQAMETTLLTELSLAPNTKYWILMSPKIGAAGVGTNFYGVCGTAPVSTYYAYMYHWNATNQLPSAVCPDCPRYTAMLAQQMYFIAYTSKEAGGTPTPTPLPSFPVDIISVPAGAGVRVDGGYIGVGMAKVNIMSEILNENRNKERRG